MRSLQKRATIYFDSQLHRALQIKAAETHQSISEIINDAVLRVICIVSRRVKLPALPPFPAFRE
jgi:predicted transcriptional regulator